MDLSGNILICGVNWIGDTIMTMPAIQAFRRLNPSARIVMLVKPAMRPLWKLHDAPDTIMTLESGAIGAWRTATRLREHEPFDRAYVLPHSFRSALVPWLARISERIGMPGHFRDAMLTRVIRPAVGPECVHQAYEYVHLLTPDDVKAPLDAPRLCIPSSVTESVNTLLDGIHGPKVALIPGAARGPSKQWPPDHFIALGRQLSKEQSHDILVLGGPNEIALCDGVARAIGARARSLAGRASFTDWVGLLAASEVVVANDSGGMHVAAAVGTPVVALYGLTDPAKTGPLTGRARVVQRVAPRGRDVARDAHEARAALAAITPDEVYRATVDLLEDMNKDDL